jgi:hypothetical protein
LRNHQDKEAYEIAALHSHSLDRHFTLHIDDVDDICRGYDEKVLYSILEEYVEKVGPAVLSPVLEDLVHRDEEGSAKGREKGKPKLLKRKGPSRKTGLT